MSPRLKAACSLLLGVATSLLQTRECHSQSATPGGQSSAQRAESARPGSFEKGAASEADTFVNAAGAGKSEVVNSMLAAGIDPNLTNQSGLTALMRAAGQGHDEI